MKRTIGRLMLAFLLLVLGYGGLALPGHANSQENQLLMDDAWEDSLAVEPRSDQVIPQAITPPPGTIKPPEPKATVSYFNGVSYSSPLVIPAAAFRSTGQAPDGHYYSFLGGYIRGTNTPNTCLMAPAYLPLGATVDQMIISIYDNDDTLNSSVELRRVNNYSGENSTSMAAVSSSGAGTDVETPYDESINDPLITYPGYSYFVSTCIFSEDIRLYSVRLYFHRE